MRKNEINKTIGTCRYIYNFYISHNKELYKNNKKFMSGKSFSVWINNEYIPNNPNKQWIKDKQLNESIAMLTKGLENLDTKTQQSLDDVKKENYIRVSRVQKLLDNKVDLNIKWHKHWNTIQRRNKRFFTVLLINCILQAIFLLCLYYYVFWIQ